jgi:hypothetical protein
VLRACIQAGALTLLLQQPIETAAWFWKEGWHTGGLLNRQLYSLVAAWVAGITTQG